ncbi:MAG: nucleotidyltransferase domain-containing protein [Acidimicrobiales bacterium]
MIQPSSSLQPDIAGERVRARTADLLWQACRRAPESQAVIDALDAGADAGWATRTAIAQRVGPLLWRAVRDAGCVPRLGTAATALEQVVELYRFEALLLLPEATALAIEPLTGAGIEPVVFKGPAVERRYPAPGLRPMDDIDLLLPPDQHEAARSALLAAGWVVRRASGSDHYDTVLAHPRAGSIALELHYGLEARYERTNGIRIADLWRRREPITCFGVSAWGLALEDEVIALAAHAGKPFHSFSRLVWIADLAMILSEPDSNRAIDWDLVFERAGAARCTTVVAMALALAGHAGVAVPASRFPVPRRGWQGAALEPLLDASWPLVTHEVPTFHLRFALVDGTARRIGLLAGAAHGKRLGERLCWPARSTAQAARRMWRLRRRAARGLR